MREYSEDQGITLARRSCWFVGESGFLALLITQQEALEAHYGNMGYLFRKQGRVSLLAAGFFFTQTLVPGSVGEDVRNLQEYLAKSPEMYPEGKVTGFFGPATESAVRRFQTRYGINPLGIVGPATREKLNSLQPTVLGDSTAGVVVSSPVSISPPPPTPLISQEFLTRQVDNIINSVSKRMSNVSNTINSVSTALGGRISDLSTDNLSEGGTNLFYKDNSVNSFIAASTTIPKLYGTNAFTGSNTFAALAVGSLNGPLQANAGAVSATSAVSVLYGGTGLTTLPSYGQIAIGNSSGGYTLSATSSLKINTDDLTQGVTNLFYSNTSVNSFIHSSTTIPKVYTANIFSGANTFSGSLTLGSLNGPLHANAGAVSATSSIGVLYGGTGLTSAPSYGQIAVGNASGGYALTATSSLKLNTDDLTQGVTNLFYTNSLANAFIHGSSTIPKLYTSNTFSGTNVFSGSVTVGSLDGPLQANAGLVSATSAVGVLYGGTGLTSAGSSGNILRSNGTGFVSTAVTTSQATPADPTTTTSTAGVMMGLAASITPVRSGLVLIIVSGDVDNNTLGSGSQMQIRYGTGSAPTNGAALTGTTAGGLVKMVNVNLTLLTVGRSPFGLNAVVSGLTPSTTYWVDISLASITSGTSRIRDVSISAVEL